MGSTILSICIHPHVFQWIVKGTNIQASFSDTKLLWYINKDVLVNFNKLSLAVIVWTGALCRCGA